MLNMFKSKNEAAIPKPAQQILPGTKLSYDPNLVHDLVHDHQDLLSLFSQTGKALEVKDYKKVRQILISFSEILREHLLTENIKLYVYLSHAIEQGSGDSSTVASFKREMTQLGQVVNQFLVRYADQEWLPGYEISFEKEFKGVGEALLKRINQEESILYRLYMPPSSYTQ